MKRVTSPLKDKITSSMLIQGICFTLCFFAFQITEFTVNDRASAMLGADSVIYVYSVGILFTAIGFLSFALIRKVFHSENARKTSLCVVGAVAVVSAVAVIISKNDIMFLFSSMLALLSLGSISGCVYYNCAMTFSGKRYTGRVIGVGMGVAVLLQFLVQNFMLTSAAYIVSVTASVGVLVYFVIKPPKDWMFENPLPYSSDNKTNRKAAWVLIAAVVLMSFICALLDGVVMPAHAQEKTSVSDYVRLFYAVSLIGAGFIADIKERRLLPLFTVCFMFLSTVSSAFFGNAVTYWVGTAFIYIFSGFYVIFLTVLFLDFAPKSKSPALWAGMGRTMRSITIGVATIPASICYKSFGNISLVVGSCVLSVIALLILIRSISAAFVQPQKAEAPREPQSVSVSKDEMIKLYSQTYGLTPRETEVLERLLKNDDSLQEIADKLIISRRVLQRYITDIYEKTSTKTRIGLFQNFHSFCVR